MASMSAPVSFPIPRRRAPRFAAFLFFALIAATASSQLPPAFAPQQGERMDADKAVDRALKNSSLTFNGGPFHARMNIDSQEQGYSGNVEVWWENPTKYRLQIQSPNFSQLKIVSGDHISEKNTGDYYPRWLENFVIAILDPVPVANNFRNRGDAVMLSPNSHSCLQRNDRPGGITDEMTWGNICFQGDEPLLSSVLTFNVDMEYSDWQKFGKKKIARTYKTDVIAYRPVTGRLTILETLDRRDEAMFAVYPASSSSSAVSTTFVSTLKEESMVEHTPQIEWPSVREGKTEGYMIVYARTDITGQVRETAKHNSDQPGLEDFGIEQALKYKFKPLLVNGVPQQMEMPLVLHFTSHFDNPIPILTPDQMKEQMSGCSITLPPGTPKGTSGSLRVSVNEFGKFTGINGGTLKDRSTVFAIFRQLSSCHFASTS